MKIVAVIGIGIAIGIAGVISSLRSSVFKRDVETIVFDRQRKSSCRIPMSGSLLSLKLMIGKNSTTIKA